MTRIEPQPLAILLDLGGVLIDVDFGRTLAYWHECAVQSGQISVSAQQLPSAGSHDLALKLASDAELDSAYESHERGEIEFAAFAAVLARKLQLTLTAAQWRRGWNAALGSPLPGAAALVKDIAAHWPVFLFSNTNSTHHSHWRARLPALLKPMRDVFVSNELGLRKPQLEAYQRVVTRIGIDADRVLFFDDRMENVDAARAAGLQACQARNPADVARTLHGANAG